MYLQLEQEEDVVCREPERLKLSAKFDERLHTLLAMSGISNGITGSNIVAMFVVGLVIFFLNNTILLKIQVENQSQMFLEARNYIGSM